MTRRLKRDENEQPSLAYDFFRFLRRPLFELISWMPVSFFQN
ncbi:hypothetical protein NY78_4418 [Desulfovibrio sp. TomC]|nr:hypothetical protein NY78_4418 [Desulfovibrio sp. TomC]